MATDEKTYYDKFIRSNEVISRVYDECIIKGSMSEDDSDILPEVYEQELEYQVKKHFNFMKKQNERLEKKVKDLEFKVLVLEECRVDPCPTCGSAVLICGYPEHCTSVEG